MNNGVVRKEVLSSMSALCASSPSVVAPRLRRVQRDADVAVRPRELPQTAAVVSRQLGPRVAVRRREVGRAAAGPRRRRHLAAAHRVHRAAVIRRDLVLGHSSSDTITVFLLFT